MRLKRKQQNFHQLVSAGLAATLALGAVGTFAAWTQTQELTTSMSAASLGMQYSIDVNQDGTINADDGDIAWTNFGETFQLANLTGVAQGFSQAWHIYLKNTGSQPVSGEVEVITDGDLFADNGDGKVATLAITSYSDTYDSDANLYYYGVGQADTDPTIVMFSVPADWASSHSGTSGSGTVRFTHTTVSSNPDSGDDGDGDTGGGGDTGDSNGDGVVDPELFVSGSSYCDGLTDNECLALQMRQDMRATVAAMWSAFEPYSADYSTAPWSSVNEVVTPISTTASTQVNNSSGWGTIGPDLALTYSNSDLNGVIVYSNSGGVESWQYLGPDYSFLASIP
jgi:predicted ribosomally synthesized peptide with SipW-like signal peptide